MSFQSVNPATGETLETYEALTHDQLEAKLALAADRFRAYRRTPLDERARWMRAAADLLESHARRWGELMTREMGKPIAAAIAEAEKCAWVCRYYADHAAEILADEPLEAAAERSFVRYEPVGPVLAVMPWNFPFWQLFRFAAPALMAGNVGLLKHASNVPGCALALEEIFLEAGFPEGAFQTLLIGSDRVEAVIDDRRVRAATLTGSVGAGAAVGAAAGKRIKKSVLELGGSDPFVVMPSADLDTAIETAVSARHINNGQSCIAAKRFIVHRDIAHDFIDGFVRRTESLTVGDPMDEGTEIGPLATADIRDDLADQVRRTADAGATIRTGGKAMDRAGWFYTPTVLTDVPLDSAAAREETFGPAAAVFVVDSLDDAIERANDTHFGLGASAWTLDASEQERFVDELEAGCVFINRMVASDPRLPFGGIKDSGYGRELGRWGMREFLNVKGVGIDRAR